MNKKLKSRIMKLNLSFLALIKIKTLIVQNLDTQAQAKMLKANLKKITEIHL